MPTITVACVGLTEWEGASAVQCVLEEFAHRPWQDSVKCEWRSSVLRLTATNDFDANGQALVDEFWDAVHACVSAANPLRFHVEAVA